MEFVSTAGRGVAPAEVEEELGLTHHETVESLVSVCDVVTINAPLHPETEDLFNAELLGQMKRGAYLVTRPADGSSAATPSSRPSRTGSRPATPATSGAHSPLRPTTRGARCLTTA